MRHMGMTALFSISAFIALNAQAQTPPAPAKTPPCVDENPAGMTMSDTGSNSHILTGNPISLKGCISSGGVISCTFYVIKRTPGASEFIYNIKAGDWNTTLVDNFKETHTQVRGFLVNGHCKPVDHINLDKNEWAQFRQEFNGPTDGVTSARIIWPPNPWGALTLHASVEVAQ